MKENSVPQNPTPLAPKKTMSDFRKALLWTSIPIIVLSILGNRYLSGSTIFLLAALGLILVAGLAAIVLLLARKRQIAAGMFAGAGIGILALGLSCFAR